MTPQPTSSSPDTIGIIGLGYVGLPMACLFAEKHRVVGYDRDEHRIAQLRDAFDAKEMLTSDELRRAVDLGARFTADEAELRQCNVYVICVPTPVDDHNQPDVRPLEGASRLVGRAMKAGDLVIYESTVYPGCTEEVCLPILEAESGLRLNVDFTLGYSPERINPGDSKHTVSQIVKVTSGSTPEASKRVDELYRSVLSCGTYQATSLRVAEACKIMENTQRDVNIALMNEMAMIFDTLGIDINEVTAAARTKWNFLPFEPGLVGGHCIGVDPYYLIYRARVGGYEPELIKAARCVNERYPSHLAERAAAQMLRAGISPLGAKVLVLGITFKENCNDYRNTKVVSLIRALEELGTSVEVYDPWVNPEEVSQHLGVKMIASPEAKAYDAVVRCVKHKEFAELDVESILRPGGIYFDAKR